MKKVAKEHSECIFYPISPPVPWETNKGVFRIRRLRGPEMAVRRRPRLKRLMITRGELRKRRRRRRLRRSRSLRSKRKSSITLS